MGEKNKGLRTSTGSGKQQSCSPQDSVTQRGLRASAKHSDKCPAVWLGWETGSTVNQMFADSNFDTASLNELGGLSLRREMSGSFMPARICSDQAPEKSAGLCRRDSRCQQLKQQRCYNNAQNKRQSLVQLSVFYSF